MNRYSGQFFGYSLNELTIASGTVFGQVLIWNFDCVDENQDAVVKKRFVGHEV